MAKKSLESQFTDSDCLGIPYIAVLNESTLEDGIVGLRSIETTLEVVLYLCVILYLKIFLYYFNSLFCIINEYFVHD